MKNDDVINKIIELQKKYRWVNTYNLISELSDYDNPEKIINDLIKDKVIERFIHENIDICIFDTIKLNRIIKLKILSD